MQILLFTYRCIGSQKHIPQVVVHKDSSVDDPCSFTFTADNWERGTGIALVASSDMLYDKVQDVNLSMVVEKYLDDQLVLTRQMSDIKVGRTDLYWNNHGGKSESFVNRDYFDLLYTFNWCLRNCTDILYECDRMSLKWNV